MVIDVHPVPQNSVVEIWQDGHILSMGVLHGTRTINKVLATRPVCDAVIEEGFFAVDMKTTFDFCYHFDSFEEWTAHLKEKNWGNPQLDAPMIERVEENLNHPNGQIVIRESIYAARLQRLNLSL